MGQLKDLVGEKFGRLTVIKQVEDYISPKGQHAWQWLCKCSCGNETIVTTSRLKGKTTSSCGCLQKEKVIQRNMKHGERHTRLYSIWADMKHRCYNRKDHYFSDYGGRGIKVCKEWENDYSCFCKWAKENGYNNSLTIDRIDVNGNYEPDNCKWSNSIEQANNKRNNIFITYKEETKTIAEWARFLNMPYITLYSRLKYYKWTVDKAFTKPI